MEQNYDDKIKEVRSSLNELERKKNKTNTLTRKERAAHLIQKRALLEIAGIDNVGYWDISYGLKMSQKKS